MKIKKATLQFLACLLLVTTTHLAFSATSENTGAQIVKADFGSEHRFKGYGTHIWAPSQNYAALKQLLVDLKLSTIRMSSPVGLSDEVLNTSMTIDELESAIEKSENENARKALGQVISDLNNLGILAHIVFFAEPKVWTTEQKWGENQSKTATLANPLYIENYASYVVSQILFLHKNGLRIEDVEVANEPDGAWDARWEPDNYATLIMKVRKKLDDKGLSAIGIEGPGVSAQRFAMKFLDALSKLNDYQYLAAISVHDYDAKFLTKDPVGLIPEFVSALTSLKGKPLEIHITEFNDLSSKFLVNGSTVEFKNGTRQFALGVATEAIKLAADGATEALLWEAEDMAWEPAAAHLGLLDVTGHRKPIVSALQTFVPYVRDSETCQGTSVDETQAIYAARFNMKDTFVIAVSNLSNQYKLVDFALNDHVNKNKIGIQYFLEDEASQSKTKISSSFYSNPDGVVHIIVSVPARSLLSIRPL